MNDIIQARLRQLNGSEPSAHIWRQVLQEVVLLGLGRAGFFERAAFQGCASLRIVHGLPRYSDNLDFVLQKPDLGFSWDAYTGKLADTLREFGIEAKIVEENTGAAIKRIFIIDASKTSIQGNRPTQPGSACASGAPSMRTLPSIPVTPAANWVFPMISRSST